MKDWIEQNGTPELKRAFSEGYEVKKGVATLITELLADVTGLDHYHQSDWLVVGERTSPRAESFANRDKVQDAVKCVKLPPGWLVEVSRISRVTLLDGTHVTGVVLDVRDEHRKHLVRAALSFE